jgi:hypothetical protein
MIHVDMNKFEQRKHCLDFLLCIFSSITCLKKPVFSKLEPFAVEGTSQVILGSSDQRKVPASLSLFLKSEKIPARLYVGKRPRYRPFRDFRPVPLAYWPREQISNQRKGLYSGPSPIFKHLTLFGGQLIVQLVKLCKFLKCFQRCMWLKISKS